MFIIHIKDIPGYYICHSLYSFSLLLTFPSLPEFKHSDASGFSSLPLYFFLPVLLLDDPIIHALWFKYYQYIVESQIVISGPELQISPTCLRDIFTLSVGIVNLTCSKWSS